MRCAMHGQHVHTRLQFDGCEGYFGFFIDQRLCIRTVLAYIIPLRGCAIARCNQFSINVGSICVIVFHAQRKGIHQCNVVDFKAKPQICRRTFAEHLSLDVGDDQGPERRRRLHIPLCNLVMIEKVVG